MTRRLSRISVVAFLSALLLAMAACGGKEKKAEAPAGRQPVTGVETVVVATEQRETFADLVGTVRARTVAAVAPQTMGRILSMPVSEGMRVSAGATIATLDDAPLRAQLVSAQGAVVEAQAAKRKSSARSPRRRPGANWPKKSTFATRSCTTTA